MDINVNYIAFIAAGLIMILYVLYLLFSSGVRSRRSEKELREKIKKENRTDAGKEFKGSANLSLVKTHPETYFQSKLPKTEGLQEWIQRTGLPITTFVFPIIIVCCCITFGFLFYFAIYKNFIASFLTGVMAGFIVPWGFFTYLIAKRKKQFLEEFPLALDIIKRALRAGHSVDRSLGMVVEQMSGGLVGPVFKQISEKVSLGGSYEEVLGETANRLGINEFRMLAIVIVLQRETGGSLAEAVDNFSKIIRLRHQLHKKVKALTAEVRMTALILTAIPFFIFFSVYIATPSYFDILFNTYHGHVLIIIGLLMLFGGIAIIMRMAYRDNY